MLEIPSQWSLRQESQMDTFFFLNVAPLGRYLHYN